VLCVQLNWPVILVGRSGGGKTELLERLAATIGVSVATLGINAETDAMDLIGGFEQTDSNWQTLQAKLALTEQSNVKALAELKVRATLSNQSNQTQQDLAGDSTSADNITKPKFQWIDGILVDALREGKWLILDNANLCSPSVLDRLNSLLEPSGVLILNERNNADGSPRIITPHPQFRIFLTMNPRYGELSRAMRNRAVELYLPEDPTPDSTKRLDPLFSESAVSRLRQIQTLDHVAAGEANIDRVSHTMVDHLSHVDEALFRRFIAQVSDGLYQIPNAVRLTLKKTVQARSQVQIEAVQRCIQFYEAVLSQTQVPADFARVQVSRFALLGM
jgi:midasin